GSQYPGQQWRQSPDYAQPDNQWWKPSTFPQNNTYVAPPSTPAPNNSYGMPGQGQQSGFNNAHAAWQQHAYYPAPYAPAAYNPSPQKRGPRVGFIVGLILLLVILVGSAFAGYTYLKNRSQTNNVAKTPAVVTTPSIKPLF